MMVDPASLYQAAKMIQVLSRLITDGVNGDIADEDFKREMRNIADRCRGAEDAWKALNDDDKPVI